MGRKPSSSNLFFLMLVASIAYSPIISGSEPSGGDVATELKPNVVHISTVRADSTSGPVGFGFIVGERDGYLYVVTARHVVDDTDFDNPVVKRRVRFFGGQSRSAKYLGAAPPWDLALLQVPGPQNFVWQPHSIATSDSLRRDSRVWFIGRGINWYVPTDAAVGSVNRSYGNGLVDIDMRSVVEGTSGAPIVTSDGIAGMILKISAGTSVQALSIEAIEEAFNQQNVWEAHPWSLKHYPECLNAPSGLAHWWPGDGNARDIAGGNHGRSYGSISYTRGKVGLAFDFDGLDSYVESNFSINLSGSMPRTVSAWVFTDDSTVALPCCPTPFSWGSDAKGKSFGVFSALGSWNFWGNVDASENLDIRINIPPIAEWVHHAITYDTREVVYYLDGKPVAHAARNLNTTSAPIFLGRAFLRRPNGVMDTPFKGKVDELQIFSRALGGQEVQQIYQAGRGGVCKN